jgi:hypothetical protein
MTIGKFNKAIGIMPSPSHPPQRAGRFCLGPTDDPDEADPLRRDQPLLAELYSASVHGRIADGPRAGQRVMTVGEPVDKKTPSLITSRRCATVSGFSLHADVCISPPGEADWKSSAAMRRPPR